MVFPVSIDDTPESVECHGHRLSQRRRQSCHNDPFDPERVETRDCRVQRSGVWRWTKLYCVVYCLRRILFHHEIWERPYVRMHRDNIRPQGVVPHLQRRFENHQSEPDILPVYIGFGFSHSIQNRPGIDHTSCIDRRTESNTSYSHDVDPSRDDGGPRYSNDGFSEPLGVFHTTPEPFARPLSGVADLLDGSHRDSDPCA